MSRNDFRRRQAQRQRRKLVRHLPIILALFLAFSALAAGVFALTRFVLNRQPISSASASSSTAKTTSEDPAQPISSPASGTLAQAAYIAAGYDYDRAIALIKEDSSLAEDPAALEAITSYEEAKASLLPADVQNVPHVFFHSLIMDTAKAFDGDSRTPGYNSVMTTKDEFLKMLDAFYEDGYVLVRIRDIASETTDENGNTVFSWEKSCFLRAKNLWSCPRMTYAIILIWKRTALHAGSSSERTENPLLKWSWKTAPFPPALMT